MPGVFATTCCEDRSYPLDGNDDPYSNAKTRSFIFPISTLVLLEHYAWLTIHPKDRKYQLLTIGCVREKAHCVWYIRLPRGDPVDFLKYNLS